MRRMRAEDGKRGRWSRAALGAVAAVVGGLALLHAAPARAWWRGGVWVDVVPPVVVGPPVVVAPPPVYYYPPAYYPPPTSPYPAQPAPAPSNGTCYAGPYVCPLDQPPAPNGACSCPTDNNGGRAWGHVG